MADDGAVGNTLFAPVHFQIIVSEKLPAAEAGELSRLLRDGGATEHSPPSTTGTANTAGLTHIVADTIDFEHYTAADDCMIPVVNRSWITTSISKKRLANPKSHSPDPRMFFSGLVVCTAELPDGDKDAIIGGLLAMGGLYIGSISRLVTHVVAQDMTPSVCQIVQAKGFQCKIVLPQWFDDCLRLGKRIDETPYMLPDPPISRNHGMVGHLARPDLQGATSPDADVEVPSSAPESVCENIFDAKTFMLGGDLDINEHLRASIVSVIEKCGGRVCELVDECDVYVGYFRSGDGYNRAYTAGKTVGNLPWLYWMVAHNRWTSPLNRLLHFPIPQDGLAGTKGFKLCLSNYSGEARIYLENLAKAAGCEFTKTLKNDNTHLVTAHTQSEKCDAAREWGLHLVNHLWLEESYARCRVQDVSNPRYTHFPSHTNLTEIVGRTPIDRDAIKAQSRGSPEQTSTEDETRSSKNSESSSPVKPLAQRSKTWQLDGRGQTPNGKQMAGKENEVPLEAGGSRSAKAKAAARLHELGPDMLLYEKELKRKGGVVYGGRRKSDAKRNERKRSMSEASLSDGGDGETPSKRGRAATAPPKLRVLVTGVPKFGGLEKASIRLREQLRALGILVTESENNCNYLVAPRILRTRKFLCAIAQAPILIDPSFLDACIAANEVLEPTDYPMSDPAGEERYAMQLDQVVQKAGAHRGKMMRGWKVWVTTQIPGGFKTFAAIVEANGGKCCPFQGRSGTIPHSRVDSENEDDADVDVEPAYLISGASEGEQVLWDKFRDMAREARREPRIVQSEWILDAALKQELKWDPAYEVQAVEAGS